MTTSTPVPQGEREAQARTLAARIVFILDEMDNLAVGTTTGQLHTPAGVIRRTNDHGWDITPA